MASRIYIDKYSKLWNHTVDRIAAAERASKGNYADFTKKMVTRLKRITHEEKVHYAIAVLRERGHNQVVDIYEGKLLMDELTKDAPGF